MFEIIIKNFENIESVLNDCENFMSPQNLSDHPEEMNAEKLKLKNQDIDKRNIIEELKMKIIE